MITLILPCGKDLNHLRIQLSEGLNLTALIDYLETCEKCSRYQGKLNERAIAVEIRNKKGRVVSSPYIV